MTVGATKKREFTAPTKSQRAVAAMTTMTMMPLLILGAPREEPDGAFLAAIVSVLLVLASAAAKREALNSAERTASVATVAEPESPREMIEPCAL